MARIRTIKPAAFSSESLSRVSVDARWTFAGLWTYVDDDGRGKADPRLIKAHVWPLDDDVDAAAVTLFLDELEREGMISRYTVSGRTYLVVVNWHHQKISHPSPSVLPEPVAESIPVPLDEGSGEIPESSRDVSEGSASRVQARSQSKSLIPSVVEPKEQLPGARARGSRLPADWKPDEATRAWTLERISTSVAAHELEKFRNYWHAKAGRDATKVDWPAVWRNWVLNCPQSRAGPASSTTNDRVGQGLALAAQLRAQETA